MSPKPPAVHSTSAAVLAGCVSALVGFSSAFPVVLAGLLAMGASPLEAGSGVAVLCITMGLGAVVFSWRLKMPVTFAWSTPGAAVLATSAAPDGGFATAVGAFVIVGALLVLTGLFRPLAQMVDLIPNSIASAMLAGVLLPLTLKPFTALVDAPWVIAPVVVAWLVLSRLLSRWAVPGALLVALVVMMATGTFSNVEPEALLPHFAWTTPAFSLEAAVAVALPLYVVTMTSQNIPGAMVLSMYGYEAPMRSALIYTGAATSLTAPLGAHGINLAAISASLAAGPEASPDPSRRWIAGVACGVAYMALGPLSSAAAEIADAAPPGIFATVAGLALITTFAGTASSALSSVTHRTAAAVTFLVAASGIVIADISAAFWALAGGLVVNLVLSTRTPS